VACLDAKAAAVWEFADGTRTITELAMVLGRPDEMGELVVSRALDVLANAELLLADGMPSQHAVSDSDWLLAAAGSGRH